MTWFEAKIQKNQSGFTIVELLVVIVVIGILAAITIVSYTGISQKANIASLTSDLDNGSRLLGLYRVDYGTYPTVIDPGTNCPTAPTADNKYCLKPSSGTTYSYQPSSTTNATDFSLYASKSNQIFRTSSDTQTTTVSTTMVCPYGFISVPGSSTYGTSDFCVMKYEARQVGATTVPISQASGLPWMFISQPTSLANSQNVSGCTGCHLITEAEWLTIAQNVLNVASNWSGGSVGSGYIYSGHNDGTPANAISADANDGNGYVNTGNSSGNQLRTLTLSNGEVIWDFSGNVWEWTQATIAGNAQPGLSGEVTYVWKQWNNGSLIQNGLPNNAMPGFTGISGASGWSSAQGIGRLYSNYGETALHSYLRGGYWSSLGGDSGVLSLSLINTSGASGNYIGFRVAK